MSTGKHLPGQMKLHVGSIPYEVAYKDQQEFEIWAIIAHRGNRFKQKTISDNESVITREPYQSLKSTKAVHNYLRKNNYP